MARLRVEVVHALPGRQDIVVLRLEEGSTAGEAARASGLLPEAAALAIGGRRANPGDRLRDGDRVDLLRPLAADPNEARRRRARRPRRR